MGADFKTVITSNYNDKPKERGWVIWSSQPHHTKIDGHGAWIADGRQEFTLVREERYELYKQLDLHWDIKTIQDAKDYVASIDERVNKLQRSKLAISKLLKKFNIGTK